MLANRLFRRLFVQAALAACVLAWVAPPALAQTSFSGIWKLRQPPDSGSTRIETIEHYGLSLKVVVESTFTGGRLASGFYTDHTYTIGGDPEVSRTDDGIVRTVAVNWEGERLVFVRTEREGANTTTTREAWTLSADGTTLSRKRHITTWRGERDEESVFDRQLVR